MIKRTEVQRSMKINMNRSTSIIINVNIHQSIKIKTTRQLNTQTAIQIRTTIMQVKLMHATFS